jgi:hypothetical protein
LYISPPSYPVTDREVKEKGENVIQIYVTFAGRGKMEVEGW